MIKAPTTPQTTATLPCETLVFKMSST